MIVRIDVCIIHPSRFGLAVTKNLLKIKVNDIKISIALSFHVRGTAVKHWYLNLIMPGWHILCHFAKCRSSFFIPARKHLVMSISRF